MPLFAYCVLILELGLQRLAPIFQPQQIETENLLDDYTTRKFREVEALSGQAELEDHHSTNTQSRDEITALMEGYFRDLMHYWNVYPREKLFPAYGNPLDLR